MSRILLLVGLLAVNHTVPLTTPAAKGEPAFYAGQSDPVFDARVSHPAYPTHHPRVLFDEAHNNADTSNGRYRPFADLIASDGYVVLPNTKPLSRSGLAGSDVLVIVNACGTLQRREIAPFTPVEYEALQNWVTRGGALLLITDQPPFSSAVSELCQGFGIELTPGHTIDPLHYNKDGGDETELLFTSEEGLAPEHPITRGRDATERINRIITFTGTSMKPPPGAVSFLKLADTALDVVPPDRKQTTDETPADHKTQSAAGRAQGLAMAFGKGRIVVLTEAAMLTAQVAPKGFRFGMNIPGTDNRQLALNIMHWLSRLLK